MRTRILKVQKSSRPIWQTMLTSSGPVSDSNRYSMGCQSYEMRVDLYSDENRLIPDKTIIIDAKHYENNIAKYGMEALLRGVELTSLLSIAEEPKNDVIDHYKREVESLAYSIVAKMEQDTFFNHYNPDKLRDYIKTKMIGLRDKFDISLK